MRSNPRSLQIGADTIALPHGLAKGSEYPPKADLRKSMSQNPLPSIAPGIVDPVSMAGDEPSKQACSTLNTLNLALASEDAEALASCFYADQAYWKDLLALTYHTRTFSTSNVIAASLLETKALRGLVGGFEIEGDAVFIPATPVLVRIHYCLFGCQHYHRMIYPGVLQRSETD